ncbi:hypothetical protein ACTMTI_47800 [Nonomuraea sp. H19]|uniref:hypothetical protein n=1 Tax=Nonomuraea sp. H19 TaxID=3452206 RepID=UPI003F8BC45F
MTSTFACELPMKPRARHWPGIVAAALTATVTVMPGFTVGALASAIEQDLQLMISAFCAATALGSPLAKRVAARLSTPGVLAGAAVVAGAVMLTVSRRTTWPR